MKTASLGLMLVGCLMTVFGGAQNLVPNPGFEDYKKCPVTFSTDPLHFGPDAWNSPSKGTPDYYNRCSIGDMDVPRNWAGVSYPHGGFGYAGIYAWSTTGVYREYVQCQLTESLRAGETYTIQFFYRLSSYSVYAIDRIGLALTDTAVQVKHDQVLTLPLAVAQVNDLETLTNGWQLASATIEARGGEKFIVIGNFWGQEATRSVKIEVREGKSLMLGGSAYYYIDDVSVTPLTPRPDTATLASPRLHEVYILGHIGFPFDSDQLLPASFPELDRVATALRQNPLWKLQLSGHTDDQGTAEYNMELSLKRAKSVARYLVQQGIAGDRIETHGFGKQEPLQLGNDEAARARNRRVEATFVEK